MKNKAENSVRGASAIGVGRPARVALVRLAQRLPALGSSLKTETHIEQVKNEGTKLLRCFRMRIAYRAFLVAFKGQAAEFPKAGSVALPSCGHPDRADVDPLGSLTWRRVQQIRKCRNKAAKPFRISIADEKQS
jgi:hypothetical protein